MTLTTTLARLRAAHTCEHGYAMLVNYLGDDWPQDQPIDLLLTLQSNGSSDTLWAFRAAREPEAPAILRLIACDLVEFVLPIWSALLPSDDMPHSAVRTARAFIYGGASADDLSAVRKTVCERLRDSPLPEWADDVLRAAKHLVCNDPHELLKATWFARSAYGSLRSADHPSSLPFEIFDRLTVSILRHYLGPYWSAGESLSGRQPSS